LKLPFQFLSFFPEKFILDIDASDIEIGAVLSQKQNGLEKVFTIGYSKTEKNYCVI